MDHHQRKANRQRRKARRRLAMGRAHDDEQEHHGHHHFDQEACDQAVLAGRMRIIAVRRKTLGDVEAGSAAGDRIEQRGGDDRADDLRDHVGQDLAGRETPARGKPQL